MTLICGNIPAISLKCYNSKDINFNFKAFQSLRQARAEARLVGIRAKKAIEAEANNLSKPAKK